MRPMNGIPCSTAYESDLAPIGFRVHSTWRGGVRSRSTVDSFTTDAHRVRRLFTISADEPFERGGHHTAPNPQELLIAALNACLVARYATAAAVNGIALERLDIESTGELDLRPPITTDQIGSPGFESLRCK